MLSDDRMSATDQGWQRQFEEHRRQLRSVAYRMLGSTADADDALQDAWLRVNRADISGVDNVVAWLTTVVARICLDQLRSRRTRGEESLVHVPDPIITLGDSEDPEASAMVADGVGLALLVVLETLSPDERVAFVLHDTFGVPFDDIAAVLDKTPAAARKLASRARQRVSTQAPTPDPDLGRQRKVVDAFFAAARDGDFEGLVSVLHPEVVLRSDGGAARPQLNRLLRGARVVASQAVLTSALAPFVRPVLVNGAAGVVVAPRREAQVVMAFTVVDGAVVAIDVLSDPHRLAGLDLTAVLGREPLD